jgi:hypothetical protein
MPESGRRKRKKMRLTFLPARAGLRTACNLSLSPQVKKSKKKRRDSIPRITPWARISLGEPVSNTWFRKPD